MKATLLVAALGLASNRIAAQAPAGLAECRDCHAQGRDFCDSTKACIESSTQGCSGPHDQVAIDETWAATSGAVDCPQFGYEPNCIHTSCEAFFGVEAETTTVTISTTETTTETTTATTIQWQIPVADQAVNVTQGTSVIFSWTGLHNVFLLAGKTRFLACEMTNATEKAITSPWIWTPGPEEAGQTFYFACQITGHCSAGQKVAITVQASRCCLEYKSDGHKMCAGTDQGSCGSGLIRNCSDPAFWGNHSPCWDQGKTSDGEPIDREEYYQKWEAECSVACAMPSEPEATPCCLETKPGEQYCVDDDEASCASGLFRNCSDPAFWGNGSNCWDQGVGQDNGPKDRAEYYQSWEPECPISCQGTVQLPTPAPPPVEGPPDGLPMTQLYTDPDCEHVRPDHPVVKSYASKLEECHKVAVDSIIYGRLNCDAMAYQWFPTEACQFEIYFGYNFAFSSEEFEKYIAGQCAYTYQRESYARLFSGGPVCGQPTPSPKPSPRPRPPATKAPTASPTPTARPATRAPTASPTPTKPGATQAPTPATQAPTPTPVKAEPTADLNPGTVVLEMTLTNIDYRQLVKDTTLAASLKQSLADGIAEEAGPPIKPQHVDVTLSAGSVKVTAVITPPKGAKVGVAALQKNLASAGVSDAILDKARAVPGINAVTTGPLGLMGMSVKAVTAVDGKPVVSAVDVPTTKKPVLMPTPPKGVAGLPCSAMPAGVCTKNKTELCLHDPTCSWGPPRYGGLGCNAGGVGQDCRFCGFKAYLPCDTAFAAPGPLCTRTPLPVCAGPEEPCVLDYQCLTLPVPLMGLGCNAGGMPTCRFCGFGEYPSCPKPFIV